MVQTPHGQIFPITRMQSKESAGDTEQHRGAMVFKGGGFLAWVFFFSFLFFFIGINNSYTVTSPNTARETTGTNGDPFLQVTELRTQSDS